MKKITALILVVVLAFGMYTTAFAASKITEIQDTVMVPQGPTDGDIRADHILYIALDVDKMTTTTASTADLLDLTVANLRSSKVTVRRSISKGSNLLDTVELKASNSGWTPLFTNGSPMTNNTPTGSNSSFKQARIEVQFVEYFVSVTDKDFAAKIQLYLDGKRKAELELDYTMTTNEIEVYDDDDYIDLSDGDVANPEKYVRNVELFLGDGVYMKTNLFANRKYYGVAISEISEADDAVISQYPAIDNIIRIYHVNLPTSGTPIYFDDLDGNYYVYNADGNYIGMSNENLPFSDKYYLATERIDMGGGSSSSEPVEPSESEPVVPNPSEPADPEAPEMGGDSIDDSYYDYEDNANDNPGTGVNGYLGMAILAGVLALATAGAVSLKKR